jgi:hypothetical protein
VLFGDDGLEFAGRAAFDRCDGLGLDGAMFDAQPAEPLGDRTGVLAAASQRPAWPTSCRR